MRRSGPEVVDVHAICGVRHRGEAVDYHPGGFLEAVLRESNGDRVLGEVGDAAQSPAWLRASVFGCGDDVVDLPSPPMSAGEAVLVPGHCTVPVVAGNADLKLDPPVAVGSRFDVSKLN